MADAVDQLRNILAKGNALIICGAGVSTALTGGKAPGWQALIDRSLVFARDKNLLKGADLQACEVWLAAGTATASWLKAANEIRTAMGDHFRAFLKHELEKLATVNPPLMASLKSCHGAGNAVATTNYDDLLADGFGVRPVTWRDKESAKEVLKGSRKDALHLHGHWQDTDSVVFSGDDYANIRKAENAQFLQQLAIHTRTLVFLGCSKDGLADENVGELLHWFGAQWPGLGENHFVLVRQGEETGWPKAVTSVVYGKAHDDLAGFLAGLAPKPKSAKLFPPNPHMIGRADLLEDVVEHVTAKKPRPLIISGGPGMGKSTLAVQAAHDARVIARFGSARRYFVRLDSATNAETMLALLAADLGVATTGDVLANVAAAIGEPTLIILDNLETPFQCDKAGVEEVLGQLGGIGALTLVNTVRGATPRIEGGACAIVDIGKLEAPFDWELFVREAGGKAFEEKELQDLLAAMDGHALSIVIVGRLASGNVKLPLLLRRCNEERAKLLDDGDDRLHNVIVSLRLSLDVLNEDAQRLARLVALLPDGLALTHARAVLGGETDKAVMALVKAGLADERTERLYMLAPLREAVKLILPAIAMDLRVLADRFRVLLEKAERIGRGDWLSVQDQVLADANNLNDMLSVVTNHGDPRWIAPAVIGLAEFHSFSGLASVISLTAAVASLDAETHTKEKAYCITCIGDIALRRSDHEEARAKYEVALPLFRKVGDVLGEANCIQSIGYIAFERSDHEAARAKYEEALPLYRRVGDVRGEANCIQGLGDIALDRSGHDGARAKYEEALPLYRRIGDVLGEANCIQSLGDMAERDGRGAEAKEHWEKALALFARIPEPYSMGHMHRRLARVTKGKESEAHVAEARRLWRFIDREDLVKELLPE
jgi:tetratricopeptide (TPR) repeat protein